VIDAFRRRQDEQCSGTAFLVCPVDVLWQVIGDRPRFISLEGSVGQRRIDI
jgi:hypothetical protein